MPGRETDALLRNENVDKTTLKKQRRTCKIVAVSLAVVCMVLVCMVVMKNASSHPSSTDDTTSILARARAAQSRVHRDHKGNYEINIDETTATEPDTTFAQLAEVYLMPWYEASILAVINDPAWNSDDGIMPDNVKPIRQVLLITRSMLDIFSPLFPNTPYGHKTHKKTSDKDYSLWEKLRKQYRHGYEKCGYLHDLKGLKYSHKLLEQRRESVLDWKKGFVAFQKSHMIRRYLYGNYDESSTGGIDPDGSYFHDASHLFWSDEDADTLPRGNDSGAASLRSLALVQLTHSLNYLNTIKNYTTVMPSEHEVNFHNLRKELRIFVDEYDLFGSVLVPNGDGDDDDQHDPETRPDKIELLQSTQIMLGHINDEWTAYNVYVEDDSHKSKQKDLARQVDDLWFQFLDWQEKHDLKGTMEAVMDRINAAETNNTKSTSSKLSASKDSAKKSSSIKGSKKSVRSTATKASSKSSKKSKL